MHGFNSPMFPCYCIQPLCTAVEACDIEPALGRFLTVGLSFRVRPYFDNRQISIPLFPVGNQVLSTEDPAYPGLYPAMFQEGAFRVNIHRFGNLDLVFNSIPQSPLVGFQLDEKVTALFPDFVYDGFWKNMASAVTMFPDTSILSSSLGTAVISLLFSRHISVARVIPPRE